MSGLRGVSTTSAAILLQRHGNQYLREPAKRLVLANRLVPYSYTDVGIAINVDIDMDIVLHACSWHDSPCSCTGSVLGGGSHTRSSVSCGTT